MTSSIVASGWWIVIAAEFIRYSDKTARISDASTFVRGTVFVMAIWGQWAHITCTIKTHTTRLPLLHRDRGWFFVQPDTETFQFIRDDLQVVERF